MSHSAIVDTKFHQSHLMRLNLFSSMKLRKSERENKTKPKKSITTPYIYSRTTNGGCGDTGI